MLPRPRQFDLEYSTQFQVESVVSAYHYRTPYPIATFALLVDLLRGEPSVVLDVGCGTGDIARYLAPLVERVDAVDFSQNMLTEGQALPGGSQANINWLYGRVEECTFHPPYALITAGESLHWMEWERVLPAFRTVLHPDGYLAIIGRIDLPVPWGDALRQIITTYSTNKDFQPYQLVDELIQRGLFQMCGHVYTRPVSRVQSIEAYIASWHSRNGLVRERMGTKVASAFDRAV